MPSPRISLRIAACGEDTKRMRELDLLFRSIIATFIVAFSDSYPERTWTG
jgi:hypothetical protein